MAPERNREENFGLLQVFSKLSSYGCSFQEMSSYLPTIELIVTLFSLYLLPFKNLIPLLASSILSNHHYHHT